MAVHKRYSMSVFGNDDRTTTHLGLEDVSRSELGKGEAKYELTLDHPDIDTGQMPPDRIHMLMTREELVELAAMARVVLGIASAEDKAVVHGPDGG